MGVLAQCDGRAADEQLAVMRGRVGGIVWSQRSIIFIVAAAVILLVMLYANSSRSGSFWGPGGRQPPCGPNSGW